MICTENGENHSDRDNIRRTTSKTRGRTEEGERGVNINGSNSKQELSCGSP